MLSSAALVNIVLRQCSTRTNGVDVHVRSKANYYLQPWYILAYLFCKKKILVNCRLHWLTRSGRSQGRQQNSFNSFHLWAPRKAPVRIGSNKKDTFLRRDVWSIYYTLFFSLVSYSRPDSYWTISEGERTRSCIAHTRRTVVSEQRVSETSPSGLSARNQQ